MKANIICVALTLLLVLACNKDSSSTEFYGSASATINGEQWKADKVRCINLINGDSICYNEKSIGINFSKFNSAGEKRQEFSFQKLLPVISLQKVYAGSWNTICNDTVNSAYSTLEADGDVIKAFYKPVNNFDNYIRVESFDPSSKKISGSFAVTYAIESGYDSINNTDTIRITNGKFSTKILN